MHLLIAFKTPGKDPDQQRPITSNLQFVQIVDMFRQLVIVKIVQHGKNCKICGVTNLFGKVCRKRKKQLKPKPTVNNVDEASSDAAIIGNWHICNCEEQVNINEANIRQHSIYEQITTQNTTTSTTSVAVISDRDSLREKGPTNMHIQFRNTESKALEDSGSVCFIISERLANAVVMNSNESYWTQPPAFQDLNTFSNEKITTIGIVSTTVKFND